MRTNDQIDVEKQVELLARIAIGDRGALSDFYDQVGRPLFALCMKILGNAEEAEEAVQDTFLMIWKHAGNYDSKISRPFSWSIVIARRICWNRLRSRNRHQRKIDALKEEAEPVVNPHEETSPEVSLEKQDMAKQAMDSMSILKDSARHCLELAFFKGMTHEEIARETRLPIGTVKTWIRRGLLKLRNQMETVADEKI